MMLYQNKVVSLHSPITNDMPRQVRKRSYMKNNREKRLNSYAKTIIK